MSEKRRQRAGLKARNKIGLLWFHLVFFFTIFILFSSTEGEKYIWKEAAEGLFVADFLSSPVSDGSRLKITVIKIDPDRYSFVLLCAKEHRKVRMPVSQWATEHHLIAAINAGMYQEDELTSVGYMKNFNHLNNKRVSKDRTFLAFNPKRPDLPPIQIIDRDCQDLEDLMSQYHTLFQGIRMISCKGENVWKQQPDKWSTAAVGIDREGNVLFIFSQTPSSVHDLIDALLALPISIMKAMYLEGGPQASLYLSTGEVALTRHGIGKHPLQMEPAIPNVLGVIKTKLSAITISRGRRMRQLSVLGEENKIFPSGGNQDLCLPASHSASRSP